MPVHFTARWPGTVPNSSSKLVDETEGGATTFTNPIWEEVREPPDVVVGSLRLRPIRLNLAGGGEVRNASASWVSGDFFGALGVNRCLSERLPRPTISAVVPVIAVLSYDFWQREYGGAADVFERRLTLSSHPVRIVGRSAGIQRHPGWRKPLRSICLFARKGLSFGKTPRLISVRTGGYGFLRGLSQVSANNRRWRT
jgi:hypothetical protein